MLLIMHRSNHNGRSYWVIPGGGIEAGESEEQCVQREMLEETNLEVRIERLLVDEPGHPDGVYKRRKTYLCRIISGEASPGFEPEPEAAADYSIVEVRWFDLRDTSGWGKLLERDPYTYPQMVSLREELGYAD
jgi:8-oxo-dGTP diphosphatase